MLLVDERCLQADLLGADRIVPVASVDFAGVNPWDADGAYINSSERWPVPSLNLSDRNYFKAFKSASNSSPMLIELVQSQVSQGRTIVIARKVSGPNGQFLGMITRSIPPNSFESFFSSVVVREECSAGRTMQGAATGSRD